MDRRNFIKSTLASAAAASSVTVNPSHASTSGSDVKKSNHYDTIVVGGGFAGVTAARELSHRGLRVLLLEASNRLGGRTFTSEFAGHNIELGGSYVHWIQPFVWAEMERYGLEIVPSSSEPPESFIVPGPNGPQSVPPQEAVKLMTEGFSEFCEGAEALFPNPFKFLSNDAFHKLDDMTVADRLGQMTLSSTAHHLLNGLLSANVHSLPQNAGYVDQLRWYAVSGFDTARMVDAISGYQIKTGMKSLIDAMVLDANVEIRTGTPVTRVTQTEDVVQVETDYEEHYSAETVVMAVPMNVLTSIKFEPGLNEAKRAASEENHAGSGTKVYAKVKGSVKPFMGWSASPNSLSVCFRTYQDKDSAVLTGYGPSPETLDVNDQDAVQEAFRVFIPGIEVMESYGYDWNLDPYIQGTWATAKKGQLSKYARGMRTPEGHIYFAGADNAEGWRGFVDGAIETGIQAARDILHNSKSES